MYDELLDDPKVQRLPPALFKTWVNLLCLASKNDGTLPCLDDIAFALRMTGAAVETAIDALSAAGLMDRDADGMRPHNWNDRQFKSDRDITASQRQRDKRARDKQASVTRDITRDITDASRPPDTDTDTDKKEEPNGSLSETPPLASLPDPQVSEISKSDPGKTRAARKRPAYPEDFEDFWKAYPTDPLMSKKEAGAAWTRLSTEDRVAARGAVAAFRAHCARMPDYRPLHAVRFISQRRFDGYANGAGNSASAELRRIAEETGMKIVGVNA